MGHCGVGMVTCEKKLERSPLYKDSEFPPSMRTRASLGPGHHPSVLGQKIFGNRDPKRGHSSVGKRKPTQPLFPLSNHKSGLDWRLQIWTLTQLSTQPLQIPDQKPFSEYRDAQVQVTAEQQLLPKCQWMLFSSS